MCMCVLKWIDVCKWTLGEQRSGNLEVVLGKVEEGSFKGELWGR